MKKIKQCQILISAAIKVMGSTEIEKITTKNIAEKSGGINEAYIYRYYENKDDLCKTAFLSVTNTLNNEILTLIPLLKNNGMSEDERWKLFITKLYSFITTNKEEYLCYLRYYYSPYFKKTCDKEYKAICQNSIESLSPLFQPNANVDLLFNYIVNSLISFAVIMFNNDIKNDTKTIQQM